MATGGNDGQVWLWDGKTGVKQAALQGHPGAISAVAFTPDGATLVSACDGKVIRIWDVASREEKAKWDQCEEQIYCAAISPNGRWLVTGGGDWTKKCLLKGHEQFTFSLGFSPDGEWLATAASDGTVKLWAVAEFGAVFGPTKSTKQ